MRLVRIGGDGALLDKESERIRATRVEHRDSRTMFFNLPGPMGTGLTLMRLNRTTTRQPG